MGVFGPIHRDVGVAQQGSQIAAVLGAEGDTDAGVGLHVQPVEYHGLLEGRDQRDGGLHRPVGTDVGQE